MSKMILMKMMFKFNVFFTNKSFTKWHLMLVVFCSLEQVLGIPVVQNKVFRLLTLNMLLLISGSTIKSK